MPAHRLTLAEIEALVTARAALIGAPAESLPSYGRSRDFAHPHVEVHATYDWVVVERGREIERRRTGDIGQLLFWVFEAVTWEMASRHEPAHRVPGQDTRRVLFGRQVELMARLDPDWGGRVAADLDAVLARAPFRDEGPVARPGEPALPSSQAPDEPASHGPDEGAGPHGGPRPRAGPTLRLVLDAAGEALVAGLAVYGGLALLAAALQSYGPLAWLWPVVPAAFVVRFGLRLGRRGR